MSVFDKDLFGLSHYEKAIKRLQTHCKGKKVLCSFSGGKDSQCCHQLLIEAGIPFVSQYSITSFEPPELLDFIRAEYPDTVFRRAFKKSLLHDIEMMGLPMRTRRWCCNAKHVKTPGFDIAVIGIRFEESARRRQTWREFGYKQDKTAYCCPICDWTTEEVWEFLNVRGLKHCKLYDEGSHRIGCVCCPLAGPKQILLDVARYPKTAAMLRKGSDLHVKKQQRMHPGKDLDLLDNPCEEVWQRWTHTAQFWKSIEASNARSEEDIGCLFDGTGFSEADGADDSDDIEK